VTHLRQKMLDELQRRNYSQNTVYTYLHAVEDFSRYFHRSPDRLGPDHIRQYQAYLFRERKLQPGTIACCTAALRFLYVKTATAVSVRADPISQASQEIARCAQSRRGSATD
jgi:integrase/recombinase XerD